MKRSGNALSIVLIVCFVLLTFPAVGLAYAVTYNDLNAKIIAGDVFGAGVNDDVTFDIQNSTGTTWTDFHMQVALGPAGTQGMAFFIPASLAGTMGTDGQTYEGPGTYILSNIDNPTYPDGIDIVGLNVLNGNTLSFSLDIAAGESGWILAGYPTTDGAGPGPSPVPEPTSILLLSLGLFGLAGIKRTFKK